MSIEELLDSVLDSVLADFTTGGPYVAVSGGYRYYKFAQDGSITF